MDDSGKKLQVAGSGVGGLKQLHEQLDPKAIFFGGLKVTGVDERDNVTSRRPKYIGLTFKGKDCGALKRAKVSVQRADAQKKMQGMTLAMDVEDVSEISPQTIAAKLLAAGGAHKPTHYEFGPDHVIPLTDLVK